MDNINVLVRSEIGEKCIRQIEEVSPRIKILHAYKIWDAPLTVIDENKDPGTLFDASFSSDEYDALLAQAEVFYGFNPPKNIAKRCPRLKWFQFMGTGVDHLFTADFADFVKSRIILTNMSGVGASPMAETVLEMMLMFAKNAPLCFQAKKEKRYPNFLPDQLRSQTVGIVGLGSVGHETARLAKAFGMRVIATRKSAKPGMRARYVDTLLTTEQLPELLSQSDFVVNALPHTPETHKMFGEKVLKKMKPTAYLIIVGRGKTIDEEAIVRALQEGWIAGVGQDDYYNEPLSPTSELWDLPNHIFSPHISGKMKNYNEATNDIFCRNLKRYVEGKRLLNIVNRKRGY